MKVRNVLIGAACAVVLAMVGGVLAFGRGQSSPSVHLAGGSAWFPTLSQGSLALLDGSTGSRVTRVDGVAPANANFSVEQSGSSALVVDRDAGTVTKVDGATWTASAPLHAAQGRDPQLSVRTAGDTAWVVSQGATVVRQLDPRSMAFTGGPQPLPASVTDVAIGADGTLWAVGGSGEVRSFREGTQATAEPLSSGGKYALATVGSRPVAVDVGSGVATTIDPTSGRPGGPVCLDVPTSTPPLVSGSTGGAPWLLGVAPTAGTLVVSDLDAQRCQTVVLGETADAPRYGAAVELNRLVFVPDDVAGRVIVVDPAAPTDQQIKARIDLGFDQTPISLLVHDGHVWFNEVNGDRAGVITAELTALVSSKADTGSAAGEKPKTGPSGAPSGASGSPSAAPAPSAQASSQAAPPRSQGPNVPGAAAGGGDPNAPNLPAPAAGAGAGAGDLNAPELPAPSADGGAGGGAGADGGGDPPAPPPGQQPGGGAQVDFTATPKAPTVGDKVTFTDTSTGDHTVTGWSAPDGTPVASTNGSSTFESVFKKAGTFDVILTVETGGSAKSVTHSITVATQLVLPDLHGLTKDQAQAELAPLGLGLDQGGPTAVVDSPLPTGTIIDTDPAAGSVVKPGAVVRFRAADALPFQEFQIPGFESGGNFQDLIVGPDGNLWVTSDQTDQIIRVKPDGTVKTFQVPETFSQPSTLVVGPDKHLWATFRAKSDLVKITVNPDDTLAYEHHHIPNQAANLTDVIVGPDGNFWVAELDNNTIGVYSPTGAFVKDLILPNGNSELFTLTKTADGNVYSGQLAGRTIAQFNANGLVATHAVSDHVGGIAVTPTGALVFAQEDGLYLLDSPSSPASTPLRFRRTADPPGIPFVSNRGDIWFLDSTSASIIQTDTLGNTVRTIPQNFTGKLPSHLIDGPGGMLWFLEVSTGKVGRVAI